MQGQIRKSVSGFYYVESDGKMFQTRARGNFRKKKITPLVGDFVEFESENETDGYILKILDRKNSLVRPPVANVDEAVVVMSLVEPDYSSNLLDRFLVSLEYRNILPAIYFSKGDLVAESDYEKFLAVKKMYEEIGYPVFLSFSELGSAEHEEIIATLKVSFKDKLCVFIGQSGAGKSTLLNSISEELAIETGEISMSLGRGRHTTRTVELHEIADGLVADTPGFSSLEFQTIEKTELGKLFPEIHEASALCKFRECIHDKEPDCEVKRRVESGEVARSRYDNYMIFLEEIEKRRPVYQKKRR